MPEVVALGTQTISPQVSRFADGPWEHLAANKDWGVRGPLGPNVLPVSPLQTPPFPPLMPTRAPVPSHSSYCNWLNACPSPVKSSSLAYDPRKHPILISFSPPNNHRPHWLHCLIFSAILPACLPLISGESILPEHGRFGNHARPSFNPPRRPFRTRWKFSHEKQD